VRTVSASSVSALQPVMSRIDYCNSVMVRLPASTLSPLQRVQYLAVWLILGLNQQSHITPALQQLHWLPVKFRIIFKVAISCTTFSTTALPCTSAISSLSDSSDPHRRQLRSSTVRSAMVSQFGRRAFSLCGLNIWNNLPTNLRLTLVQLFDVR